MNNKNTKSLLVAVVLIIFGAFARLHSAWPNVSVAESLALFSGAYLGSKYIKYLIPIVALYLSDLVINNTVARSFFPDTSGFVFFSDYMIYNIIAMIGIVVIGSQLLKKVTFPRGIAAVLVSTLLFFLITNFGAFISSTTYTKDFSGLVTCYAAGLFFLKYSLLGNLGFSFVLFGTYELYKKYFSTTHTKGALSEL